MEFNTFLTVFLAVLLAGSVVFFAFSLAIYHQKRTIMRQFRAFFEAPDEETPSQFAETIDVIGRVIASRLVSQIKSTVMGMNSVDSKNDKREQIAGMTDAMPTLAGLAQLLPKKWARSPEIMATLMSVLGNFKAKGTGNGSSEPSNQTAFKL